MEVLRQRLRSIFGSGIDILSESITHRNKRQYAIVSDERSSSFLLPQVRTSFQADQARNRRNASRLTEQRLGSSHHGGTPDPDEEEEELLDPKYENKLLFEEWLAPRVVV